MHAKPVRAMFTERFMAFVGAAVMVTAACLVPARGLAQSAQGDLIREYLDAFKPHNMVGVLIPIGQQAGDVLDRLGEELVHRRKECFGGLTASETPSSLPNFDLSASAALRLGLGVKQIADADLHALGDNHVILRFEDVTVQTISQGEFRQMIDRHTCPEIGRLIDKDPEALRDGTLLVGEVFLARRIVRLNRARDAGGGVSTSWLSNLASRLGLTFKAEVNASTGAEQAIELSSREPVPVAFRPAFIRLDPAQPGYRASEGRPNARSIVAFNPRSEEDRLALSALIDREFSRVANP